MAKRKVKTRHLELSNISFRNPRQATKRENALKKKWSPAVVEDYPLRISNGSIVKGIFHKRRKEFKYGEIISIVPAGISVNKHLKMFPYCRRDASSDCYLIKAKNNGVDAFFLSEKFSTDAINAHLIIDC